MTCFSNLGPVYIKPPVTDLYLLNLDFKQAFPEMILITYAIIDERNDRNELIYQKSCTFQTKCSQFFSIISIHFEMN